MNMYKSRRKEKRYLNHLLAKTKFGMYVVDCRGHPCIVTEQQYYSSDMYGWGFCCKSLIDNSVGSCSLAHCGPLPLSKEDAYKLRLLTTVECVFDVVHLNSSDNYPDYNFR